MAFKLLSKFFFSLALVVLPLLSSTDAQGLQVGFYQKTCPAAEAIILAEITRILSLAPTLRGPLLRMHFHDCFVNGCDGSVLLNATGKIPAEKDSLPNLTLRGYGAIEEVKAKLEKACPGIVSCADILAVVARDVVVLSNGPTWAVPTGRRDGNRSVFSDALSNLPQPTANFTVLLNGFFKPKGLDEKDLVVLSGGHTLGTSHCSSFSARLYNFTGMGDMDPTLDKSYAARLKIKCKPNDQTTLVQMDPGSFEVFDEGYYRQVAKRRGLFSSDETLLHSSLMNAYVVRQATAFTPSEFFTDFPVSMVKMGNISVLTGNQGNVRKKCYLVN